MKNTILLFTFFVLFYSCVFKLEDENFKSGDSYLAVSSDFTDVPGQQVIRLSYSSNSTSRNSYITNISSAAVSISDDQNNIINFSQEKETEGKYVSTSAGVPGRKYTLHITMKDGKKYHSLPETMPLAPDIKNLYYKFEQDNSQKDYIKKYGYNVYIDFKDSPDEGDFYQWNWIHYEVADMCSTCDKGRKFENSLNTCKTISVFPNNDNANNDGTNYFKCNSNCWDISRSDGFNLLSDSYYNGQDIQGVKVHRALFKSLPSQYYLQIQQRKINKSTYFYLKSLETQLKSNGTLFDVPAQTQFNFNIYADDNPNEKVLGIFNVYSLKMKFISIPINQTINGLEPGEPDSEKIPYQEGFPAMNIYSDCINSFNRANTQPEGWKY